MKKLITGFYIGITLGILWFIVLLSISYTDTVDSIIAKYLPF